MFIFDLTDLPSFILSIMAVILFIYLSQEIKNSKVALLPLVAFVVDLIIHTIQVLTLSTANAQFYPVLCFNMAIDYVFVLVTFLGYLWADEVEAKALNKKVIKNSGLDFLWKKV